MSRHTIVERSKWPLATSVYKEFLPLTYHIRPSAPPTTSARLVVCKWAHSVESTLSSALLQFSPSLENASIRHHYERHNPECSTAEVKISVSSRKSLYTACALAVTIGNLPTSSMDRKFWMQFLAKSLIEIGRHMKNLQDVDLADLISCTNTVLESIGDMCKPQWEIFRPFDAETFRHWRRCDVWRADAKNILAKVLRFRATLRQSDRWAATKMKTQVLFLALSGSGLDTEGNTICFLKDSLVHNVNRFRLARVKIYIRNRLRSFDADGGGVC